MLTPYFELSDNDVEVFLRIRVPWANVTNSEILVVDDLIVFSSPPYYLRIHLPGHVTERRNNFEEYNYETSQFSYTLTKVTPGEQFKDLDLIGKLLRPSEKFQQKPKINVLDQTEDAHHSDPESDEEEFLCYLKQEVHDVSSEDMSNYGFANKGSGLGNRLMYEFKDILDLVHFENSLTEDRSELQVADEQLKFSEGHYLADFMESEEVCIFVEWNSPFKDYLIKDCKVQLTQEEEENIKKIGNKDYLLDQKENKIALFSLVDILFAYAYNHRTTMGEDNVESAWTINKLSSTLSWLQSFNSMREVKIACARRSLIFPLYRHWGLTMTVFNDTLNILKLGRTQILKCLLQIYELFNESEPRYLFNELYINDYCVWIQKIPDNKIECLAKMFEEVKINKCDVELELDELEDAALIVKEESELTDINRDLKNMRLSETKDNDDDESDEESDTSEEEASSETESSSTESSSSSSLDSNDLSIFIG